MAYTTPSDYAVPDWSNDSRVHEWKNYISKELRQMWGTFSDMQKAALARNAQECADREEWD